MLLLILLLGVVAWGVAVRNSFTRKAMKVSEARSGVEVALTKRYDVLTKLLDACRGYLGYESSVLLRTVALREQMSLAEMAGAENQMDLLTEQVLAAAERIPALRSSAVLRELQVGMTDTERHVEAARQVYNSNVRLYNRALSQFPASLLAGGLQPAPFFEPKRGVHQDLTSTF